MAKFESGVSKYVPAVALVYNFFPVDHNGREYCCCEECFFYREASKTCGLDHRPVLFPAKYVGEHCLLLRLTDEQMNRINTVFAEIIMENEDADVQDE